VAVVAAYVPRISGDARVYTLGSVLSRRSNVMIYLTHLQLYLMSKSETT
jgi:hypothetical protein